MHPGQDADLDLQRAYLVGPPPVETLPLKDHLSLDLPLGLVERLFDLRGRIFGLFCVLGAHLCQELLAEGRHCVVSLDLGGNLLRLADLLAVFVHHHPDQLRRYRGRFVGLFHGPDLLHKLLDHRDGFLNGLEALGDSLGDYVLGHLIAGQFEHVDRFAVPADDQVHYAAFKLVVGGVDQVLIVLVPDPCHPDRTLEWGR